MNFSRRSPRLPANINGWKQKIVAFAGGLGAPGLFLISFLDSSVLTFPVINDLLLIELSVQRPTRMPLYAAMAMLGSTLGCVLLYFSGQKGRGSALPPQSGTKRRENPTMGRKKRIPRHAGCRACSLLQRPLSFSSLPRECLKYRCSVSPRPLRWRVPSVTSPSDIWRCATARRLCCYLGQHKVAVAAVVVVLVALSYRDLPLHVARRTNRRKWQVAPRRLRVSVFRPPFPLR